MFRPCSLALAGLLWLLPAESLALARCDVTFAMTEAVAWGALRFTIDYPQPEVAFDAGGAAVQCVGLGNVIASFEDDQAGTVLAAIVGLDDARGPAELVRCALTAASAPAPEDFAVRVVDGADSSLAPMSRFPAIAATSVDCPDWTATAVLGDATPATVPLAATTTTMAPGTVCTVDFRMSSTETLGALQFNTDYSAIAGGTFDGIGPAVVCTGLVADALHSFNDLDASRRLRTSIVDLNGFTGPVNLSTCIFLPVATGPIPSDFVITVLDASTPTSQLVRPLPGVEISAVSCVGPTTTTTSTTSTSTTSTTSTTVPGCGDGATDAGEQCDDGAANSNADPDVCRRDCLAPYVCADADDNGQVTVSDAQRIVAYAVGALDRCDLGRCDTTGDGRVTVSDAQRALFEAVALEVDLRCLLPVRVSLVDVVLLGSLSLEIHYGATGSSFLGSGAAVACTGLLPHVEVTFDNDAANDTLRVTASSLAGIGGPVDVAECLFRERDDLPAADAFTPQATGATDVSGGPVSPPSVSLRF